MQEELNSRTMTLIIEAGRISTQVLQKAIRESLNISKKAVSSMKNHTPKH